jgi:hypothetical protein
MTTQTSTTDEGFAQALQTLASLITGKAEDPKQLQQKRLFEHWSQREEWLLHMEAIPLLIGQNPATWEALLDRDDLRQAETAAWENLKAGIVQQGRPRVLNPTSDEAEWRVQPTALVPWARSVGVAVPEYLETLLQFIFSVVKKSAVTQEGGSASIDRIPDASQKQSLDRERVLGAALNILSKCPEQCYDEHGFVSGQSIVKLIRQQSMRWFDVPEPPMKPDEMAAFIDKWLE